MVAVTDKQMKLERGRVTKKECRECQLLVKTHTVTALSEFALQR